MAGDFDAANAWHVTIDAQYQGSYGEIYQKMLAAIASGGLPGLVVAYQNQAATYQPTNTLVDVNTYVNDPEWGGVPGGIRRLFPGYPPIGYQRTIRGHEDGVPHGPVH